MYLIGVSLGILGGLLVLFLFADNMVQTRARLQAEQQLQREERQRRMRHIISMMMDHSDADILDDLEWQLQTLLYEHRRAA